MVIVKVSLDEGVLTVSVMVDAVNAVLDIKSTEIEPAPSFGAHIRNAFIKGMGKVDDDFIIMLDAKVLSLDEMTGLNACVA